MMPVAFYMDEHVPHPITRGLRRRGVDVLRAQDDGHDETGDDVILDRAATLGRVVFTLDDDFLKIAQVRQTNGVPFAGAVYAHQERTSYAECIYELEVAAVASDPSDWVDTVRYIPV